MLDQDKDTQSRLEAIADKTNAWGDQNLSEGGVCDFCAWLKTPLLTYLCESSFFIDISALDTKSLGAGSMSIRYSEDWAACTDCAEVIDLGDAEILANHVASVYDRKRVGTDNPGIDNLILLYKKFFSLNPKRQ